MNESNPVTAKPPLNWFRAHQKEISYGMIFLGLTISMIAVGIIACTSATPTQYSSNVDNYPANMGVSAEGGALAGAILLIIGTALRMGSPRVEVERDKSDVSYTTTEAEKIKVRRERLKNVALVVLMAAIFFGFGMALASGLIMHNSLLPASHNHYVPRDCLNSTKKIMDGFMAGGVLTAGASLGVLYFAGYFKIMHMLYKRLRGDEAPQEAFN